MIRLLRFLLFAAVVAAVTYLAWIYRPVTPAPWSESDLRVLRALWIESLEPLPPDPTNAVADNPAAVLLGNRLFFDTRLSANGEISCAVCHQPGLEFTDGLQKGKGIGESKRNTRSVVGSAYSPWLYWDGRRDSLWAQALSPIEDPEEHGSNRMQVVRLVYSEPTYRQMYESLFGPVTDLSDTTRFPEAAAPGLGGDIEANWSAMTDEDRHKVNTIFANIGKAIAAYERTLNHEATRFDLYVEAALAGDTDRQATLFSKDEILGLQLFLTDARCTECHNGPLFTNNEFHNTGILAFPGELPDRGRIDGVREVLQDPFNCRGDFSDSPDAYCGELDFVRTGPELIGAMRTPSLRNISRTAPYMRKGQVATLTEVLEHYNSAPDAMIGHNEAKPLSLSRPQLARLEAFLNTLAAPVQ